MISLQEIVVWAKGLLLGAFGLGKRVPIRRVWLGKQSPIKEAVHMISF